MREGLGRGTLLSVTYKSLVVSRGFFMFWFGFLALWTSVVMIGGLREGKFAWAGPLIGAAFGASLLLINAFGRALARGDVAFLDLFLHTELALTDPPAEMMPFA